MIAAARTPAAHAAGAATSSTQRPLSAQDLAALQARFAEQGYVVLKGVVPADGLSELREQMLRAFQAARQAGTLFSGGGLMSGHLNCAPGEAARFAYDVLLAHGVIDLVRAISPASNRLPNVGCNFNLPGSVTQHYHTDGPFTWPFMIANVAVVDTDLVNGAINLVPGTHQRYYPFWQFALGRLPNVRQRMQQGDVLVRSSVLWHRGMPNRSAVPRPMLAFTWEDGGSVLDDPFQANHGQMAFQPNWFHPTRLGRLRERTFVAAPLTYDAFRFARSLVGKKGY